MATYDLTAAGGTTGHPSNGRTPYLVENTIDVSAINGDSGAAQNDVLRVLDIPAETLIMEAGIEVITALSCLLYTSPSPRDTDKSRMPSSA